MIPVYDEHGRQWALVNDKNIHDSASGGLILWIWGRHLFTWRGEHVGFFENGWLRDHDGRCVGFTPDAEGGAALPADRTDAKPVQGYANPPDSWPRRQGIPGSPDNDDTWALLNGRGYFTTFIDAEGETRSDAAQRWAEARDRVAASLSASNAAAAAAASESQTLVPDDDAVGALNAAIAAYRELMHSDDAQAVALARVDLHAAAEKYAILSGATLTA